MQGQVCGVHGEGEIGGEGGIGAEGGVSWRVQHADMQNVAASHTLDLLWFLWSWQRCANVPIIIQSASFPGSSSADGAMMMSQVWPCCCFISPSVLSADPRHATLWLIISCSSQKHSHRRDVAFSAAFPISLIYHYSHQWDTVWLGACF